MFLLAAHFLVVIFGHCFLFVFTDRDPVHDKAMYPKHVMILTRGTRGDVQPYIALARGLAELQGWMVTICTELSFKSFVKSNANVQRGCIRFRPSGGDTAARIDTKIAKWAMQV
jgi:sterol 3beta-glucosyltransferase